MNFSSETIVFSCAAIVFFSCERDSTRDAVRVTFDFFERFFEVVAIKKRDGLPSQAKLRTWPERFTQW